MSCAEFWALTVAQFAALMDRYDQEREWQVALNGRLMWAVFAASGAKKKGGGRFSIKDFVMQRKNRKEMTEHKTPEQLVAVAERYNKMLGGVDLRKKEPDGAVR